VIDADLTEKGAIRKKFNGGSLAGSHCFFTNLFNARKNYYKNVLFDFLIPFKNAIIGVDLTNTGMVAEQHKFSTKL
jgi:hypothetical protein